MKEKFKEYLVEQFRTIAPTKAAMEFRKKTLKQLLDRAQELEIKGITDKDLIYNMCIDELGDFQATLQNFQNKEVETDQKKRAIKLASVISALVATSLVVIYLIVGGTTGLWHPAWIMLVGGVFLGVSLISLVFAFLFTKDKVRIVRHTTRRLTIMLSIALLVVFVFLVLQVGLNIKGSWQAFLVLPVLLFGADNIYAHSIHCSGRWYETPVVVELLFVMLYVLLGLNVPGFWHPGWIMCLVGVLEALVEVTVFVAHKNKKDAAKEKAGIQKKYKKEDPRYYTDWDD